MAKKITCEEAQRRFANRTDIKLIQFISWKKESLFFDKVINEYFWAKPKNVFTDNSSHPKRKIEKIKQTCLVKYGVENPTQNNKIKEKIIQTNLQKYGVENVSQIKEIKKKSIKTQKETWKIEKDKILNKRNETNLKRYGVKHPSQKGSLKNKIIETNIKKYGVSNPSQVKAFKDKRKNTFLSRYGVEHQMLHKPFKEKVREKQIKYFVKDNINKKPLIDWIETQMETIPYSTLQQILQKNGDKELYSSSEIKEIISFNKSAKTLLEKTTKDLLKVEFYNKRPNEIKKLYRPDFKLNDQTYLNVDGLFWHSQAIKKDKWYHFILRKEFEKVDFKILQFREDEVYNKTKIIKSIVNNILNKTPNKIFARKCTCKKITQKEASIFLKENHLMGTTNAKHIGLYCNDVLVAILSWKCKDNICKIERFCSKINHSIVGGFSKLLNHLERNFISSEITQIHNWVDLRYGTGKHLENKGFIKIRETLGWKWTDGKNTFNRLKCKANMDERRLTQKEHANEMGWFKIYDAGQRLWIKKLL